MLKQVFSTRNIILILILIGTSSILSAENKATVLILMGLSYISNLSYSGVSRSAVRNSALYHAIMLLLSNIAFYSVLYRLKTNDLSLQLFIPYTVATVFGSLSGAKVSMRIEDYFGITTGNDEKASAHATLLVKRALFLFFCILVGSVIVTTKDLMPSLYISGLVFGSGVAFSLVRRSRNSDNTTYHIFAFMADSLLWFLLYRNLSLSNIAITLFPAYCLGSISGGLAGQKVSEKLEKFLGTSADAHLKSTGRLMPWRSISAIICLIIVFLTVMPNKEFLALIAMLAVGQQIAFSMVSRSRNRANLNYHLIASIFSNGVWFLTFRQLNINDWNWSNYPVYASGGVMGSITGVGISMNIEKSLNISSDNPIKKSATI